ncbi:MAG: hypothetical protein JNM85_07195 [Chthonomonas sp.]|nr:hypothetical protein [Chthonomonas sp.]
MVLFIVAGVMLAGCKGSPDESAEGGGSMESTLKEAQAQQPADDKEDMPRQGRMQAKPDAVTR